ncbi:autotransporter outer membrane beta-barrel domain-containing protein [Pseudomonas solani]|uniref:autotransporter outer membrane beta-barrel domain-containing protein n=1 Tax=Pseudomonas solani TaxID=2731552 RepID=UPI003C2E29E7
MKTHDVFTAVTLQNLARNRLAKAISLVLAGMFTFDVSSADAQVSVIAAGGVGIGNGGDHSHDSVSLNAATSTGVKADGTVIEFNQGEVKSGAANAAAAKGQNGLHVLNDGELRGTDVRVELAPKTAANVAITATDMTGALATQGGVLTLENAAILMGGGVSGLNNRGLVSIGGIVDFSAGAISTLSKGSIAVLAMEGGKIVLCDGTTVTTTGNSGTTQASHGLYAQSGGQIAAEGIQVTTSGTAASAARADGGSIQLKDSSLTVNGAATSTTTTAALHALNGGQISGSGLTVNTTGTYVGGARAEGAGSQVSLAHSTVQVEGAGVVANPSAAARAMGGASLVIDQSDLLARGTYGHGVSVEGAGSSAIIERSNVTTLGARSTGLNVTGGATADVRSSSVQVGGTTGPAGAGVLVENAGSAVTLSDTEVSTSQKSSYGVRALDGAAIAIQGGKVQTSGDYSAGISAAQSRVEASDVTVHTSGNDNAMGVVADLGATVILNRGSVTTTGNGAPVASNLTYAHGLVSRNAGALLVANGTSVHTTGSQSYGAAVDDGGSMVLNDLAVKTEGDTSRGLYAGIGAAKPGAVSLIGNNISVQTLGTNATGAFVSRKFKDESAELILNNSSVVTQGAQSHGLQAESGANLSASHSLVLTEGSAAHGAVANSQGTQMNLDGVAISAQGDAAHGALVKNGAQLDGRLVQLHASGAHAAALATQAESGSESRVTLTQGVLDNRSGATVDVTGAAAIALDHVLAGGSGQWLNVDRTSTAAGQANLDLRASMVNGSAKTATGSTANLNLRDTSIWQLTGDSNLTRLDNDASLIDFSAPVGGTFKILSVNNYHGANGTIALNTYLFDDASPSDLVVIDGGNASGQTNLQISNAGGAGALTTGNGIKVVDALHGATTDADAFRLLSDVKAGPYQYTLHRSSLDDSNGEAWYLRSTQGDDETPNYRKETSLYGGIPVQALLYSRAMVDTLHERVGEERRLASVNPLLDEAQSSAGPSLGWGRMIYRRGADNRGAVDYDYNLQALQVGTDLYRHEDTDGSTDQAGLSLGLGRMTGALQHIDGRYAGDDALRAYSLGGYWTHFGPAGWYLDGVLQLSRFSATAKPDSVEKLHTRGHGVTASLEVGYPMLVHQDKEIYIEPQAQVIVSKIKLKDASDSAADVRFDDVDALTGRVGVRVARDWFRTDDNGEIHRTNVWLRPSVWHEFNGSPKAEFSSSNGYVPFTADMGGTWGELNLGVDYELNARTSLTGSLGYQKAFDGDSRSYEGMFGIKVKF